MVNEYVRPAICESNEEMTLVDTFANAPVVTVVVAVGVIIVLATTAPKAS